MSIMTRMIRLWKADFNGLMDELEDKELLLRQHLREMEDELEKKRRIVEELGLDDEQLGQELNTCSRELEELEKDLKVAVVKKKDDIARMLIRKIKIISRSRKEIEQRCQVVEQNLTKMKEEISNQEVQYNRLKRAVKDYVAKEERRRRTSGESHRSFYSAGMSDELSSEEVELELLKYKEMFQAQEQGGDHETGQ